MALGIQLCTHNGLIAIQLCKIDVDAPSACPCVSWPGVYPWTAEGGECGGLLHEYAIDNAYISEYDGITPIIYGYYEYAIGASDCSGDPASSDAGDWAEFRIVSPATVRATSQSCRWESDTVLERRYGAAGQLWQDWEAVSQTVLIWLDQQNERWVSSISGIANSEGYKYTGLTPSGTLGQKVCDVELSFPYAYVNFVEVEGEESYDLGIQLCNVPEPVPQECPPDLEDEYDVTVCGHTFTVTREAGSADCYWTWHGSVQGCGIDIEGVFLTWEDLGGGNYVWRLLVAEDDISGPWCVYDKDTGGNPKGEYILESSEGGATCDASALVEDTAP